MSSKIVQTKEFPLAPRDESVSDEYHGVKVADPYRVLEDADNEQTVDFVHRINEYSRPVLDAAPNRDKIEARIRKLWDYRRVYSVGKQGEYLYFFVNDGVQNQDVLYQSSLDRTTIPPRVFLDMNAEAEDGSLSIRTMAWSKGETDKILAYSISENGSDESVMHFKTEDGVILEDKVHRLKHTSISWIGNHSVLYSRYRSDELEGKCGSKISTGELNSHTVYLHKLGTSQCDDVVVFEHDDPKYHIRGGVTFSSNYAYYILTRGCDPTNLFYLEKIVDGKLSGKKHAIVDQFEYKFDYHGSTEDKALILTNKDGANRFKVMSLPLDSEDASGLTELIPEYPDRTIENIAIIKQGLLVSTLKDLKITLALHDLETGEEILKIIDNEIMSCPGLSCRRTLDHFYMSVDTFTRPTTIFKVTINGDEVEKEVFDQSGNGDSHNFDNDIVVSDHNALNPDGTKVHYFVLESKKSAGSGNNNRPALVYGYGGFNISLLPGFSITRAMFVDNFDGVYVLTNLRGGSEFGEDWHAGGMLKVKENTFNDMISVVNDVVERGYTKHSRITIQGGSNGGLLVAACAQRAPQSVAAVVCNVGVLDMIRFPLFTVGAAWVTEYGDVKKPDFFEYLMRYSPLHNLKTIDPAVFPATLVLTADHDDRVVPGHSLKYLAELYHQAQRSETSKLLMGRIEEKAGHGAGKSTEKRIMEVVDIYSFMSTVLDLEWKE